MGICSPINNKLSKHQNHQILQIQQIQNNLNGKITNIKLETEKKKEKKNDIKSKIENEKNEKDILKKEEKDLPKLKYIDRVFIWKKKVKIQ